MTTDSTTLGAQAQINRDGFALLRNILETKQCLQIAAELETALTACADEASALRRHNGVIYGARNLLALYPQARRLWGRPAVIDLLTAVLGEGFGLVRGLYFDKPPHGNWSLPWHQDLTIAVKDHSLPSEHFRNRTVKAGVPHVEAPDDVLRQMLTLRIHVDDATEENGPLQVLPGTHVGRDSHAAYRSPVTIFAAAGDVLAMRPLLSHCSGPAHDGSRCHRRVIHLEFSANITLPDGYRWHEFCGADANVAAQEPR